MRAIRFRRLLPRFIITQVVVAALWSLARAAPAPVPASVQPPSRSTGSAEDGKLIGGVELPAKARGMRRLRVVAKRGTGFGTRRLVELVQTIAAQLSALPGHGGVPLRVGNLSRREGGPIRWSHSHRSGRDVDLALYALSSGGRSVSPNRFLSFDGLGRARVRRRHFRFDAARNWHLIRALVRQQRAHVAHLYLAAPLRRLVLEHARSVGEAEWLVQRAARLLQEPLHAGRHDDHLHVRLYCSRDEVLTGCIDQSPRWPWVPDHAAARRARIDQGIAGLGEPEAGLRHQAVALLAPLHRDDRLATGALVWAAAFDEDAPVRAAAVQALAEMGGRWTFQLAMASLPGVQEPATGDALLRAGIASAQRSEASMLLGLLGPGCGGLGHLMAPTSRSSLRRLVARRIRPWMLESAAEPLLDVLVDPDPSTRRTALRTLEHLANRRFSDANTAVAWHDRHGNRGRLRWLIEGFYRRGLPVDAPASVLAPLLIGHLRGPSEVHAHNAEALLRHISRGARVGYVATPSRRHRAWQRWWQVHQRRYQWPWAGQVADSAESKRLVASESDDRVAGRKR